MIARHYRIKSSLLFLACITIYSLLVINLYSIQIAHVSFFSHLATQQYTAIITQTPPRAYINDRNNKPIAINKMTKSAFVLPKKIHEQKQLYQFLKNEFPTAYNTLTKGTDKHFMYVKRRLSSKEISIIKNSGLTDINFLDEPSRFYPFPCTAPIVGMTDIDTVGLFGIEYKYNKMLTGTPTSYILQKDARSGSFYFEKTMQISGIEGTPITLTLDSSLQFLVEQELAITTAHFQSKEGAAVIMDPITGEIHAMVTIPFCNPNIPEQFTLDETKNRTISDAHERGSVFKVFSALAALAENVVSPDELIDCKGTKTAYIDGRKINTVYARGVIPFTEVIASSNNIGIAIVAKRLDEKLYTHYERLGFGKKTGVELPGEHAGYVNPPSNWSKQSLISLSYGYEVSCTLLQLATAFSVIANGGYAVQPTIIMNTNKDKSFCTKRLYDTEVITTLQKIIASNNKSSMRKALIPENCFVMGKTGTANILENGHYNPDKNSYSYVGMVQHGTYNRVVALFVKESNQKNQYGSTVALPLFERLVHILLMHDKQR